MQRARAWSGVTIAMALIVASACRQRAGSDAGDATVHRPDASIDGPRVQCLPVLPPPDAGWPIDAIPPAPSPQAIRWIGAGGGVDPESNQVSLAQDLALAREVLGPAGIVLFASGPGARVQVLDPADRGDPLVARLGALFDPRQGRDAHYAFAPVAAQGEATADRVREELRVALGAGDAPLLLVVMAHGDRGDTARDDEVLLWGQTELHVEDLTRVLDTTPTRRTVRVMMTSCFSGGFAEMVFRDAREQAGVGSTARCGLFAATWDHESSGCDPDPDRRDQESYALHVFHALRGEDRDGARLDRASIDFDGDGVITLLEAHTRARIAGRSIDVPTTTSERWLRSAAPGNGPSVPVTLPEEEAVIRALLPALDLADPTVARARLAQLQARIDALHTRADRASDAMDEAARQLTADVLARWPVLDDPWHPDWPGFFTRERDRIAAFLDLDPASRALADARDERDRILAEADPLEVTAARMQRLVRAIENRELAGRLRARGGAAWDTFERLRACERTAP